MKVAEDIIAFKWVKPKSNNDIIFSDYSYKIGLRPIKTYIGEAILTGENVKKIFVGDRFLIEEFSISNFNGKWKEGEVYFVKEKEIKVKLLEEFNGHIKIIPSESWKEAL